MYTCVTNATNHAHPIWRGYKVLLLPSFLMPQMDGPLQPSEAGVRMNGAERRGSTTLPAITKGETHA